MKGFPESFDVAALHRFVDSVRNGLDPLPVPVYDHVTYDIAADPLLISPAPPIVVLEGVFLPPDLDVVVYLDADEGHIIEWFVARFMQLRDAARTDPASFYCRFLPMSDAAAIDIAHQVWDGINGPNLHRHIAPQRDRADIVVRKGSDHRVSRVDVRDKPPL